MSAEGDKVRRLSQYLTPVWAAEALVDRYFPDLNSTDLVIEPTCGQGAYLGTIPAHIPALGVEIDPVMAEKARRHTGREVLVGDFRTVPLDVTPTVILGNPPFDLDVVDGILQRSYSLLPEGGRVGFLLPTYAFQTASRVALYAEQWSLRQEMIPRNIYPGLSLPLVFALFSKERHRTLIGFALYQEVVDVQQLPKAYRKCITAGGGPVWLTAVRAVIERLGGEADLQSIYSEFEGKRPTKTRFWREQIRKVLRLYSDIFLVKGPGRYALAV